MSLINCPECGRENISDKAEICPNCGFGIKAHFDTIQTQKAKEAEKKELQIKIEKETEILYKELEEKVKEIENRKRPHKPSLKKFISDNIVNCLTIVSSLIFSVIFFVISAVTDSGVCLAIGAILIVLFFIGLLVENSKYEDMVREYENWDSNIKKQKDELLKEYDKYEENIKKYGVRIKPIMTTKTIGTKEIICSKCGHNISTVKKLGDSIEFATCEKCGEVTYKQLSQNLIDVINNREQSNPQVKCPYCNSTNVKKISTTSKVASVAAVGVFALGKATKVWHCNNCESNFG